MRLKLANVGGTATALFVLAAGTALSLAAAFFMARQIEHDTSVRFAHVAAEAQDDIETRIRAYSDMLLGVRALFIASDSVTRDEFQTYIASLDLNRRYPGVQVVHYAHRMPSTQELIVQYVEPMAGNEGALGLDLGGDAVRLATLERTRDSGQLTASGPIALAKDPRRHPGFAMRLPVYRKGMPSTTVEERRAAFTGMVSASFVVIDLMRGVLSGPVLQSLHVRIHDAGLRDSPGGSPPSADDLMFDSDRLLPAAAKHIAGREDASMLARTSELDVGGRRWKVHFSPRAGFIAPSQRLLPWATLAAGLVISVLLFGLIRSSRRAVSLAEQQFQATFDQAAVGIAHFDLEHRNIKVNRRYCEIVGYAPEELLGKSPGLLNHPDDAGMGSEQRADLLTGAIDHFSQDKRYIRKDRTVIWVRRTESLARDDAGAPQYYIRVIEDITERKEAEERYRATVDNAPVGIMHTAIDDDRILHSNSKLCEMLGYTHAELARMMTDQFIDPDYIGSDQPKYREAMLNDEIETFSSERLYRRKDGAALWVNRTVSLVKDAAGKPLYFIRIIEDINERKQSENRQAMEHAVTRVLADAETLAQAIPKIIQTICETLKWHCGARWMRDEEAGLMRCFECWGVDSPEIREFVAENSKRAVTDDGTAGQGLVRQAAGTAEPVWVADLLRVGGFRRAPLVAKANLRGAFCFPLLVGSDVLGVMEFFHRDVREPDEMLIRAAQSIGRQIGQYIVRQQAEESVRHLAHFDGLTGLPNRSMFNERLEHALAQARRADSPLAILFIDLDRFKNINDTLGHAAGDFVLREVAHRLQDCLRDSDTVGRLGGDEFVVLVEEPQRPLNAGVVAQKLLAALGMPFIVQAQEFDITASIGISSYPDDGADMQTLMKNADIAMYRAKEQGRNNFQFYSANINVHSIERLTLESSLRRALERDEFLLHYQPKVDIASGRITGVEALLRWEQPAQGLIPPGQFIQLAEETGLIVPIGEWVLRTACAQGKAWQREGWAPLRVAVNLSPRQFANKNLLRDVAQALEQTGLDPSFLELEITESVVMHNPADATALLNRLKAFGIHLAIDDFGTGYSSLGYLKRFPLDTLKVDRTFIRDLPGDSDDIAITQAIIAMAHSLRLRVVAEGVETVEQVNFLRNCGCDEMQGYYFSAPRPAHEIVPLLRDNAAAGRLRALP